MISRTILKHVELAVKCRPVTLITGARQVGKSTIAQLFMKSGFSYVSLDNSRELEVALKDPQMFLQIHKWPLIIDEVQKAPGLFNAIEEVVNNEKMRNPSNYGMYILTGSQMYNLMKGVSESMSGRVAIIHLPPVIPPTTLVTSSASDISELMSANTLQLEMATAVFPPATEMPVKPPTANTELLFCPEAISMFPSMATL